MLITNEKQIARSYGISVNQLNILFKQYGLETEESTSTKRGSADAAALSHSLEENKKEAGLESLISNYRIFIDTSSLMNYQSRKFFDIAKPILLNQKKKIYVLTCVVLEVKNNRESTELICANKAKNAENFLTELSDQGLIQIIGRKEDGHFADRIILSTFQRYRSDYRLLLITNDKNLARETLNLNKSEANKGYTVLVKEIDKLGFLSDVYSKQNTSFDNLPDRTIELDFDKAMDWKEF